MPADASSPIDPIVGQLVDATGEPDVDRPTLLSAMRSVPDPRDPRGVRHPIGVVLAIAACAVIAGARSYVAIAQWAADAGPDRLAPLGCGSIVPCESTIRRTLQRVHGDVLDRAMGAWSARRSRPAAGRRFVAVDGKSLRGAIGPSGRCRHLLAAITHHDGVVLGQVDVDVKTNEIPRFSTLLDSINIQGSVITADALHVQIGHADYLHRRGADFILTVTANQPGLLNELTSLPWRDVPASRSRIEQGHGRRERRSIKLLTVAAGIGFPHAAQAFQITRKTCILGTRKWRTEIVPGVTSIPAGRIRNEHIADGVRGHWTVENRLHWVRDVTFDEDRSQIRTSNGPRVTASLRNMAVSAMRLARHENLAAAIRTYSARSDRPVTLLLNS